MTKPQGSSFNLALEMAPPRIIATHRRKSSEFVLDTILEENAMVSFSQQSNSPTTSDSDTSSPTVRQQRFVSELSRIARFPGFDSNR